MVGLMTAALLAGCTNEDAAEPAVLGTEPAWDDETYGISLLLHDGSTVRAGEACEGSRCAEGDDDGRVWLDGLTAGEHTVDLFVEGSDPTIAPVHLTHDQWSRAATQVYEAGLVDRFLPLLAWERGTTGMVDLWVRDLGDNADPMGGATIEVDVGDVYVSGGSTAFADDVTLAGGPAWITNLPAGEVVVRVSAPGYVCRRRMIGWPTDDVSAMRLPVEVGSITSAWIGCNRAQPTVED